MNSKFLSISIIFVLFILAAGSTAYSTFLASRLAQVEQSRAEIWAEATRQLIQADEDTDIAFITTIIEGNTTIPVYMLAADSTVLLTRNVTRPVSDPWTLHGPIEVVISNSVSQYIYYDDSLLLKRLRYFPYIWSFVICLFVALAVTILFIVQRNEQNRVWAGLSKETAHQLGTPLSSLNGWYELLKNKYPDDEMIPQMGKDIARLVVVADRFGKIGSKPTLRPESVEPIVQDVVGYMRARVSKKVNILFEGKNDTPAYALINKVTLSWVLENLIRNAVDAEATLIIISLDAQACEYLDIIVRDNGKGMTRSQQRKAFQAGYTTKQRGWGLGLSLAKRIVENDHRGKLFLQSTELGKGTTFVIRLKQTVNR